jgi:hypothetical protein
LSLLEGTRFGRWQYLRGGLKIRIGSISQRIEGPGSGFGLCMKAALKGLSLWVVPDRLLLTVRLSLIAKSPFELNSTCSASEKVRMG